MALDYQSLVNISADYNGSGNVSSAMLLKLALLKSIAASIAPSMATDYQSLISGTNVAGYSGSSNASIAEVLEMALLQIIANAAGTGGATTGTVNPTGTSTAGSFYLNTVDNTLWVYNGTWRNLV